LAAGVLLLPSAANAITTLTFSGFANGEIVDVDFVPQGISTIATTNLGAGPNFGITADSGMMFNMDPDLEGPPIKNWSAGNLPSNTALGNILIIQTNSTGCAAGQAPGSALDICDDPNDEGARPAGNFDITFTLPVDVFGFDLVDVENLIDEPGSIDFYEGLTSASLSWAQLQTRDGTIVWGDNSANRINSLTPAEVTLLTGTAMTTFDRIVINMGGSGAIDNLVIPEPGTAGLLVLGMLGLAAMGRSRH
jgi:hypothetical protein